jgi:hypothetical protein
MTRDDSGRFPGKIHAMASDAYRIRVIAIIARTHVTVQVKAMLTAEYPLHETGGEFRFSAGFY